MAEPIRFKVKALQIPMKVSFKHASAERQVGESLWVEATRSGITGCGEGCPRSYVTGETLEGSIAWARETSLQLSEIQTLEALKDFSRENEESISKNLSAWCALELAMLDLLAQEAGQSIEKFLDIQSEKRSFQYSAVLSADDEAKFKKNLRTYASYGFSDFKLKAVASLEEDLKRIDSIRETMQSPWRKPWFVKRAVASIYASRSPFDYRLRIDGNNAWAGREKDIVPLLEKSTVPIWAIEEPFAPRDFAELSKLSVDQNVGIILGESLCGLEDVQQASAHAGQWIANLRVSKLGGLLRSLEIVKLLRRKGWDIIVGAQVGETSVLSRAALVVAQAAGNHLVAQEGAFGTLLLSRDVVEPELRFGLAGVLKPRLGSNGLGLRKMDELVQEPQNV